MMTTMTSGAVVTAAGTAIPEVIRKLHAAAGRSVRALLALTTVTRTTTSGARALARGMTTTTSGAAVAVTAAGTVIPKVTQKLHAAGADSRLGGEPWRDPWRRLASGGGDGSLSATDALF